MHDARGVISRPDPHLADDPPENEPGECVQTGGPSGGCREVIVLGEQVRELTKKVNETHKIVSEISDFLAQVRGGRKVLLALGGLLGGLVLPHVSAYLKAKFFGK